MNHLLLQVLGAAPNQPLVEALALVRMQQLADVCMHLPHGVLHFRAKLLPLELHHMLALGRDSVDLRHLILVELEKLLQLGHGGLVLVRRRHRCQRTGHKMAFIRDAGEHAERKDEQQYTTGTNARTHHAHQGSPSSSSTASTGENCTMSASTLGGAWPPINVPAISLGATEFSIQRKATEESDVGKASQRISIAAAEADTSHGERRASRPYQWSWAAA